MIDVDITVVKNKQIIGIIPMMYREDYNHFTEKGGMKAKMFFFIGIDHIAIMWREGTGNREDYISMSVLMTGLFE